MRKKKIRLSLTEGEANLINNALIHLHREMREEIDSNNLEEHCFDKALASAIIKDIKFLQTKILEAREIVKRGL